MPDGPLGVFLSSVGNVRSRLASSYSYTIPWFGQARYLTNREREVLGHELLLTSQMSASCPRAQERLCTAGNVSDWPKLI